LVSLFVSIGLLFIMAIGSVLEPAVSALCCLPWSCLGLLLILSVPESPPHLAKKGKSNALSASAFYHGRSGAMEMLQLHDSDEQHRRESHQQVQWDSYSRRMLIIVSVLAITTRMSGIPVLSYYLVDIISTSSEEEVFTVKLSSAETLTDLNQSLLHQSLIWPSPPSPSATPLVASTSPSSLSSSSALLLDENTAAIICGVTELLGGVVSLFLTDAVGRRPLLLTSYLSMSASLFLLSLAHHLQTIFPSFTGILAINLFYLGFALGCAPVFGVLLGELFPMQTKGPATTIAVSLLWAGSFAISKLFFLVDHIIGRSATFGMFSVSNFLAAIFVLRCVPETRKKSLAEIQQIYQHDR